MPKLAPAAAIAVALFWASSSEAQPLTLAGALAETLQGNRSLAMTDRDVAAADALVGMERAALLPSVDARAATSFRSDPLGQGPLSRDVIGQVQAEIPLLNMEALYATNAASLRAQSADFGFQAQIEETLVATAIHYAALQEADQAVLTARAQAHRSERLWTLAKDRVGVGLSPAIDEARAHLRWLQDRQREVAASGAREVAVVNLAYHLGRSDGPIEVSSAEPWSTQTPPDKAALEQAISDATAQHPEALAAERASLAVARDRKSLGWSRFLELAAYGEAGIYAADTLAATPYAEAGITASLPLFSGLGHAAALRRAQAMEQRASWAHRDVQASLETTLRARCSDWRTATAHWEVASAARAVADQELAFSEERYLQGLTDNAPVVEAQARVAEVELAYQEALTAYNLAYIRWMAGQGRLHELAR